MKLCKCGEIVKDKCARCYPSVNHKQTTAERGYDHEWRKLSESKRKLDPLCEECERKGFSTAAESVHHVVPIRLAPHLRLVWSNLMSVCNECHELLEANQNKQKVNSGT
jgi:5-methylcytosine-specific restriction enzyme A